MSSTAFVVTLAVGRISGAITTVLTVVGVESVVGRVGPYLVVAPVAVGACVTRATVVSTAVLLAALVTAFAFAIGVGAANIATIFTVISVGATRSGATVTIKVAVTALYTIATSRTAISIVV